MKIKSKLFATTISILLAGGASAAYAATEVVVEKPASPPTTVIVEKPATPPTTIVITKPKPKFSGYNVCYQRIIKNVNRNTIINRCNPYGTCREIILPHSVKIIRYKNCTMMPKPCPNYFSKWSWYPTPSAASKGLNNCRNQPVIIQRQ